MDKINQSIEKWDVWNRIIGIILVLISIYLVVRIYNDIGYSQWDFKRAYFGCSAFVDGLSPYNVNNLHKYFNSKDAQQITDAYQYLPNTLYLFKIFTAIDYKTAHKIYLILKCLALFALLYLWKKNFLDKDADLLFYLFCFFAFNSAIYIDLRAGNISIYEQLIIWLALHFFLLRKYVLFSVLIAAASYFKFTPIMFVFLLFFTNDKKRYKYLLISISIFLIAIFSNYLMTNNMMGDFVNSNFKRSSDISLALYDYRGSIAPHTFNLFYHLCSKNSMLALMCYCLTVCIVIFTFISASRKLNFISSVSNNKMLIYFACVTYVLVTPLFKDYSYIILIVPAYYIVKKSEYIDNKNLLYVLMILPGANMLLPVFSDLQKIIFEFYQLFVAVFVWGMYLYYIRFKLQ